MDEYAHALASGVEWSAIALIVVGAAGSTLHFVMRVLRREDFDEIFHRYRVHLGRTILIGLELLVAADIIGTIAVEPTFRSLGVLGLIALIRTFLSFSLEVEIEGRWPWQRGAKEA